MLQSKAGVENREYKAQRSILADADAGKISKEELYARAEELLKERLPKPAPAHKPTEPKAPSSVAVPPVAAAARPSSVAKPNGGATTAGV
jgi:hypothetical protein